MTKFPGVHNTIDRAIQANVDENRRMSDERKAASAHRRGFNSGLAGEPDEPIGIGAAQMPAFDAGVAAGLEMRRMYTGRIPSRHLPNGRFGLPRSNPAFRYVAVELYGKVPR